MRIVFECLNLQVYMRTAHVVPRNYIQQQNWWFGSRRTNKCKHCWTLLQRELEWNSILKSYNAEIMCRKTLFWQSSLWEDLPWKRQRQNHMEPLHWHFTECLKTRALIGRSTSKLVVNTPKGTLIENKLSYIQQQLADSEITKKN